MNDWYDLYIKAVDLHFANKKEVPADMCDYSSKKLEQVIEELEGA